MTEKFPILNELWFWIHIRFFHEYLRVMITFHLERKISTKRTHTALAEFLDSCFHFEQPRRIFNPKKSILTCSWYCIFNRPRQKIKWTCCVIHYHEWSHDQWFDKHFACAIVWKAAEEKSRTIPTDWTLVEIIFKCWMRRQQIKICHILL